MAFNYPTNVSSMTTFFEWSNEVTSDGFGIVLVLLTFIVFYMAFARWGALRGFAVSSFITCIVAIMLRAMNLVSDLVILFCVTALIFALIGLKFMED